MLIIKDLEMFMDKKIRMAKKEIEFAIKHKEDDLAIAKLFYDLSVSDLQDMNDMHAPIVSKIQAYRKEHGEPPAAMMAVYDWQHEKQMSDVAEIKVMQTMLMGK